MNHPAGAVVLAVLALAACGPDRDPGTPNVEPSAELQTVNHVVSDSLELSTRVSPRVHPSGRVDIELTARNPTPRALDLYLRGRDPTAEVLVRDEAGAVVWRKLEGAAIPAILQLRSLMPGDSLVLRESWTPRDRGGRRLPPGTYRIEAELLVQDGGVLPFPAITFELLP